MAKEEGVLLGHVAGAHGIAGAVRVHLYNADSNTLRPELELELRAARSTPLRLVVDRVAAKPGSELVRVWLREVVDRDSAAALQGREVWVDRSELPALADDEYYLADLIGRPVMRGDDRLGTIVGVTSNGMQDLFEVELGGQTWLLPAMPPFVCDVDDTRVLVDVHDDMLPTGGR